MEKELNTLLEWLQTNTEAAIAVVTKTWGSAPRRPGSLMVMRSDGTFEGSVSGGCVEGAVIGAAQNMLSLSPDDKRSDARFQQLDFTVSSNEAWQVGLACGGAMTVALYRVRRGDIHALQHSVESLQNRAFSSLSLTASGFAHNAIEKNGENHPSPANPHFDGQTTMLPLLPVPHLVIIGAVHIAQHLAIFARECGFMVTVVDPRAAFTDRRNFSGAHVICDWPDDYFASNRPDAATALVTLTHDPKLDDSALMAALDKKLFYIGSLGSRKNHATRLKRLAQAGAHEYALARIHGPVGIDIKAASPAEIAISVMAQVIAAWRGAHAGTDKT